jgi:hypothetical protein
LSITWFNIFCSYTPTRDLQVYFWGNTVLPTLPKTKSFSESNPPILPKVKFGNSNLFREATIKGKKLKLADRLGYRNK